MSGPDFSTRSTLKGPRWWDVLFFLVGVVLLVASVYQASVAWAELGGARRGLEADRRANAALLERVKVQEKDRGATGDALARQVQLTTEAAPETVLADLAALLPRDVRLDSALLTYGPRLALDLRVVARQANAYDSFLDSLGASPLFEGIVPGVETREGEVRAQVQAVYRGRRAE